MYLCVWHICSLDVYVGGNIISARLIAVRVGKSGWQIWKVGYWEFFSVLSCYGWLVCRTLFRADYLKSRVISILRKYDISVAKSGSISH